MTGPEVRIQRTFPYSVERVFAALTDPRELVRWWGPRGISTSVAEIDLQPGGACRWVMHPEGRTTVLRGTIIEVEPPELVSMTNQWEGDDTETLVTFRLTEVDGGTELEIHHQRLPADPSPLVFEDAWNLALQSLSDHLPTMEEP